MLLEKGLVDRVASPPSIGSPVEEVWTWSPVGPEKKKMRAKKTVPTEPERGRPDVFFYLDVCS